MADGHPPARNVTFRVIKHDKHRGQVLLKFLHNDCEAESYLKSVVRLL